MTTQAASTSETSVSFYKTTERSIPENFHLHEYLFSVQQKLQRSLLETRDICKPLEWNPNVTG
jgi:hypothetical protein